MGADYVTCMYCGWRLFGVGLGPDRLGYCQRSPSHRHIAATDNDYARTMAYWEQQRRAMFRQIADAQAVRGQWHEGTCSGCGLDDKPVIGLPGSELCEYCEELRQLVPVPEAQEPAQPATTAADLDRQLVHRMTLSVVLGCAGIALAFTDVWMMIPAILLTASLLLAKTA